MAKLFVLKNYKILNIQKSRMIPECIFVFGPKRDEVTEDGWSLHDEKVHELSAHNILWVI